jgi:hypothetical protein
VRRASRFETASGDFVPEIVNAHLAEKVALSRLLFLPAS